MLRSRRTPHYLVRDAADRLLAECAQPLDDRVRLLASLFGFLQEALGLFQTSIRSEIDLRKSLDLGQCLLDRLAVNGEFYLVGGRCRCGSGPVLSGCARRLASPVSSSPVSPSPPLA